MQGLPLLTRGAYQAQQINMPASGEKAVNSSVNNNLKSYPAEYYLSAFNPAFGRGREKSHALILKTIGAENFFKGRISRYRRFAEQNKKRHRYAS